MDLLAFGPNQKSATLPLVIVKPGVCVATNQTAAKQAMLIPGIDAVVLSYLKPEQQGLDQQTTDLQALQMALEPFLKGCLSPGHKVFTREDHSSKGPEELNEGFLKLVNKADIAAFKTYAGQLVEEYLTLCGADVVKLVCATFPKWPLEDFTKAKDDHLLTFTPHAHPANPKDWHIESRIAAPKWYLDVAILGAGMFVAGGKHGYDPKQQTVQEKLKPIVNEIQALASQGTLTEEFIIAKIADFWKTNRFDPESGYKVDIGVPVLLKYQSENHPGSIHWRSLSDRGHLKAPQVASLNFIVSGGKAD